MTLATTAGRTTAPPAAAEHGPRWSGVFAMTLCVFTLIASEFIDCIAIHECER